MKKREIKHLKIYSDGSLKFWWFDHARVNLVSERAGWKVNHHFSPSQLSSSVVADLIGGRMVEEEENEEGEGVGGGENLERGGGELVADSERKRSSEGEVCWLASKRMMGIGHWPRENIFQPNCQILSNNPGFSHSKFFIKSKSHKHILLRKRMWNELCTYAQGPPATFQRMDQLSHILKPVQRLGPERSRWGELKTLNLTCSKMHCCKSGTQAS